jgi:predicted ArsR family transcriptional regulator
METPFDVNLSLLQQAKIQARVLVPLLRAFRTELGEQRANQIAWRALAEWRCSVAREMATRFQGSPAERWAAVQAASIPSIGDAVDMELIAHGEDALQFNVTGCRFADFFRALGEPDLGFELLCAMDGTMAEEIGGDEVRLTRSGTIMQGAPHCDFHYALKKVHRE